MEASREVKLENFERKILLLEVILEGSIAGSKT